MGIGGTAVATSADKLGKKAIEGLMASLGISTKDKNESKFEKIVKQVSNDMAKWVLSPCGKFEKVGGSIAHGMAK